MVPVEILGLHFEPRSGLSVVLLSEVDIPTKVLPILVGPFEARAIMTSLSGVTPPRPGTYDLMTEIMKVAGAELVEVAVTALEEGTFLATLEVEGPGGKSLIPARPSDGLALAVRVGASIVVNSQVFEQAGVQVEHNVETPFDDDEIEDIVSEFEEFLATTEPSDFDEPESDGPTELPVEPDEADNDG